MLIDFSKINLLAVFIAALVPFALGFFWYSKAVFGRQWQKEVGLSDKEIKNANMAETMGVSFIGNLIMSAVVAALFHSIGGRPTIFEGLLSGATLGVGLVAVALLTNYLFEQRSYKLWYINAGYMIVNLAIIGAVLALFM